LIQALDQQLNVERLSQQAQCAAGHCSFFQPSLCPRGYGNRRYKVPVGSQSADELDSAHARHLDVGYDAVDFREADTCEEGFRRIKSGCIMTMRPHQPNERGTEGIVIFDYRDLMFGCDQFNILTPSCSRVAAPNF
jgi:hypothetical protein